MRPAALAALLALALPPTPLAAEPLGQAVYDRGEGTMPIVGDRPRPARAGRMTCAGCHAKDASGGREGGADRAPPITWAALTEATPSRPAYDEAALAMALTEGRDPAGRMLRMPRFAFAPQALPALIAHLRALDATERIGLTPRSIALRLPKDPALRQDAEAAIAAFNAEGGSYGRRIILAEPAFLDLGAELAAIGLSEGPEAATALILQELRNAGRGVTRTKMRRALSALESPRE